MAFFGLYYNFDRIVDRRGSGCYKYDHAIRETGRKDIIPLWVADMDFETPDFIVRALRKRMRHPVFGYTMLPDGYFDVISSWVRRLHGWKVKPGDIRFIPGIVKGIGLAELAFLRPGDKVIIQPPVYHPFRIVTEKNGFEVVNNPLKPVYDSDGALKTYEMDFEDLEKAIDDRTRMLILSNPHNPCGIGWSADVLRRLAEICACHGIIVISDEIHSEMMLDGVKHIPFASVSEAAKDCAVTFMAPSKTFNIAGVVSSYCIIEDALKREKFFNFLDANELDSPDIFAPIATVAAYRKGGYWRRKMLAYVKDNIDYVDSYLRENIPEIRCVRPQASFLVWLDCRALNMSQAQIKSLFLDKAGLYLNDGEMFGREGRGFMRLNVGCPRATLVKAMEQLKKAVAVNI